MIPGDWYNPGSFVGATAYPADSIGQILYKTSTISFPPASPRSEVVSHIRS